MMNLESYHLFMTSKNETTNSRILNAAWEPFKTRFQWCAYYLLFITLKNILSFV